MARRATFFLGGAIDSPPCPEPPGGETRNARNTVNTAKRLHPAAQPPDQQATGVVNRPRPFARPTAVVLLAFLGLAGGANEEAVKKESWQEYYQSLKGEPENRKGFKLEGPDAGACVHFEPAGLRITLPLGYARERSNTGVRCRLPVKGDFEITVNYEILQEPEPAAAEKGQTRLTLGVGLDRPGVNPRPFPEGCRWTAAGNSSRGRPCATRLPTKTSRRDKASAPRRRPGGSAWCAKAGYLLLRCGGLGC